MNYPTIKSIRVRAVRVPMEQPHQTAAGTVFESPLILTDIASDDGTVGHSIVFTYNLFALNPTAELIKNLETLLIGVPLSPQKIEQILSARFRLLGIQGLVGIALAAIDMAVWDALARRQKSSLLRLLGGIEMPIRAYGAVGYDGVANSADCAEAWVRRGFKGVKAKIGYPTVHEDIEVIRAIRSAVGNDCAVMVDYNQSLTPTDAIQRLRALDSEGLTWIEEPTLSFDYVGQAEIARQIQTPIQSGENWWGTSDMQHSIDAMASDYVMPDVMKIGGVSGWTRAAAIAHVQGLRISNHLWSELSAQLLCVTPTAHWLEYCDWWNPVLKDPLKIIDGYSDISGVMGSGIEWNEPAVARFLV